MKTFPPSEAPVEVAAAMSGDMLFSISPATKSTPHASAATRTVTITLKDGRKLHKFIEHAIGSSEVPMTDAQLVAKFTDLADGILPAAQTRALIDMCWKVEQLPGAASIATAAVQQA